MMDFFRARSSRTPDLSAFMDLSLTATKAPTSEESPIRRLDMLSRLLDTAFPIPGTHFRIGLDGLLGLLPGIGDSLGAVLSTYIIFEAARLGCPKRTLVRMLGNVAVETAVGAIPIIGDLFDFAWKANVKNIALLRAHRDTLGQEERSPRRILSLFLVVLGLIIFGLVVGSVLILRLLYQFITT
jgi:hypothetical protein